MQCSLDGLKQMRSTLNESAKEVAKRGTEMAADGSSYALLEKIYSHLAKNIRDPGAAVSTLREMTEALSSPVHRMLRIEMSEEIQMEVDGKAVDHYLLKSELSPNRSENGLPMVVMRIAPADNIGDVKTYVFEAGNDQALGLTGTADGVLIGGGTFVQRALDRVARQEISDNWPDVKINDEGDPVLGEILSKMDETGRVLGSSARGTDIAQEKLIDYDKVEEGTLGDIGKMKELLGKLHVLGGSRAGEGLMTYYSSLLDRMHPSFFNKMDIYYKRNAPEVKGVVMTEESQMRLHVTDGSDVLQPTEAEIYMQEVVHSMTAWALGSKVNGTGAIKTELNKLMAVVSKKLSYKDFLDVREEDATERDKEVAEKKLRYIMTSANNIDEFLAHTLTNPALMRVTQDIKISEVRDGQEYKTLFGKILGMFSKLIDTVLGAIKVRDKDQTVFDRVNDLAFILARVNDKHQGKLTRMNAIGKMMGVLADSESYLARKIAAVVEKVQKSSEMPQLPDDAGLFRRTVFSVEVLAKAVVNPAYRGALGLVASAYGIHPGGTIREFLAGLFERDELFRAAEAIGLIRSNLDATRNSIIDSISKEIRAAAKVPLDHEEETAVTTVMLETNLATQRYRQSGAKKYSDKEMISFLVDDEARYTRIGRIKHTIKDLLSDDEERARWTTAQAVGLGYFMATGEGHQATNTNSVNIVTGDGTNERFPRNDRLEAMVSELASLSALDYVPKKDREIVARLMKHEKKYMNKVTDYYDKYIRTSKETVFKDSQRHMMEGHTQELFDDTIDLRIAPLSERVTLESEGFTFRYELKDAEGVKSKEPMAVYTTNSWGKAERLRGAVSMGVLHTRGTKLSSLKMREDPVVGKALFQRDFSNSFNKAAEIHESMRNGTFDPAKVVNGLVPIYGLDGRPVDYRYTMSKERKRKLLGQRLEVSEVLSRSIASLDLQIREKKTNEEALLIIREDMKENWKEGTIGEDGLAEYVLIGPERGDDYEARLYQELPATFKRFINNRADKTMAVRKDLVPILFGGTHMRTTDLVGFNLLPGVLKSVVNALEGMWMSLIKISKGAILIKMPAVLINNALTNVLVQIAQGQVDIRLLARDYRDSIKEVDEYLKAKKRVVELVQELDADTSALRRVQNVSKLKEIMTGKRRELDRLRSLMAQNPAHELFEAGYYQSYIEDVEKSAITGTNRVAKAVNSKLDKLPKPVRVGVDTLYMTQNTSWYKWSQEVLQRSDMVARMVSNKNAIRTEYLMVEGELDLPLWWLEDKSKSYPVRQVLKGKERTEFLDKARTVRMNQILDTFINYTLPNGRFEEYANRMGVLMFTKYIKRIHRVATTTAATNPIKTALFTAGAIAGLSMDGLVEQSLFGRALGHDGDFSVLNIINGYSPYYHLQNVLQPPLLKDEMLGRFF